MINLRLVNLFRIFPSILVKTCQTNLQFTKFHDFSPDANAASIFPKIFPEDDPFLSGGAAAWNR